MKHSVLGKLVGNTGDANKLTMVVENSFSVRRGEFVPNYAPRAKR